MKVLHYIDKGYKIRFSGGTVAVSGHQNSVSNILKQLFGLEITGSYSIYTSAADDCKMAKYNQITSGNLSAACTHFPKHLTTDALRNKLIKDTGKGTSTTSKVLWTGHVLDGNPRSNSQVSNYSIVMTLSEVTNSSTHENLGSYKVKMESRFNLIHELSHQLGAPDHYCYGRINGNDCANKNCTKCTQHKEPPNCIMTYRYDLAKENINTLYCSSCLATIKAHLKNHH